MPFLRRSAPADPVAAARLAALLPRRTGWVPPELPRAAPDHARPGSPRSLDETGPASAPRGPAPSLPDGEAGEPGGGPALPQAPGERDGTGRPEAPTSPLDRWRSARIDPGRRGVAVLGVLALLAGLLAGTQVLRSRPQPVTPPVVEATGTPVPGSLPRPGRTPSPEAAELVVAVAGKVLRPGLVRLPPGSRVADAVTAAGGAAPDADLAALNLARRLVDGEQVLVGVPQPPGQPPAPGGGVPGAPAAPDDGPLDLNTATLQQLDALPGIGPVLAQKVLDWREEHGRFDSVDQLREVSGIGEAKYAQIEPEVRV